MARVLEYMSKFYGGAELVIAGGSAAAAMGRVAAQGEVYVQFWLREGDAAVEVSFGEEGQEELIPGVPKRHL